MDGKLYATPILLIVLLIAASLGPVITPFDPLATNPDQTLHPPSAIHWFGTDQLGRDVFSRVLVAARLDLMIAFTAVALSAVTGTMIGAVLGYFSGWMDMLGSRLVDILMAFPLFALAMVMVAILGNTILNVVIATAIVNLPFYIRLARSEINIRRHLDYVDAARLGGSGHMRILRVFLLPDIMPVIMTQASVNLGWAVLNTAGLSFLGFGVRPPAAEWGVMVAEGARFVLSGQWWIALFPGLALVMTVLIFHHLGDWLRDYLDKSTRQ